MATDRKAQLPIAPIVGFVGNYGSGKTEVAVNYALQIASLGHRVNVADLDIVNPYFRCREAIDVLESQGIHVVVPRGEQMYAELPILLPEVRGLLKRRGEISVLDVGGDDVGARALSHMAHDFPAPGEYRLLQVINRSRPFTDTVAGCLRMRAEIEASSRLRISGLVSNTHLIQETTVETIEEGYTFALEVAEAAQLPLEMVVVPNWLTDVLDLEVFEPPVLVIDRQMNPPWLQDGESIGWAGERERLKLMRG